MSLTLECTADPNPQYCECCGRALAIARIKWLELNCLTGRWSDPALVTIPENESQGCFPFGVACARRRLKEQQK